MRLTVILFALFLGACASAPPVAPASCGAVPTELEVQTSVQSYVAAVPWKDPASVQVRNVRLQGCGSHWRGLINGGGYLVGREIDFEVNAKNSYGGYTGFEPRSVVRMADGTTTWGRLTGP